MSGFLVFIFRLKDVMNKVQVMLNKEITILIHGFNKKQSDMSYLEAGLKAAGFAVFSVNLPTTFGSLEQCRNAFSEQVKEIVDEYEVVNYVAHSMGGLITRAYIDSVQQNNVGKCVFIATPHKGSRLAAIAAGIPLYARIFRPVSDLLPNLQYRSFTANNSFKIAVIAGSSNDSIIGRLFLPDDSDGRVEIASVKSNDMDEFIVLPYNHHNIHKNSETLAVVA